MELLAEILFEVYGELMFLIIPEKSGSKTLLLISKIMASVVFLGVIALVLWGVILISDHQNMLGAIPITIGVLISLGQIISGVLLYKRNH